MNRVTVQLTKPLSFTVEINGYSDALCVFANRPVSRPQPSENLMYFGPGEHRVGILRPKDNQTVFLEQGAVVYGGVLLQGVKNVYICGRGILDGSGLQRMTPMYDQQPENLFVIRESENVTVEGIILRDAPCWAFTTRNGCRHIRIENFERNDCIRVCHHALSIDTWYGSRDTRVENILYETADCSDLAVRYQKLRLENIKIDGDARRFVSLFDSSRLAEPMEIRITGCDLGAVRWNK